MEQLEGRQSILAALQARQRRFEVILMAHGAHVEKFTEVLELASQLGVPVKTVDRRELDALSHGRTHGGLVAMVSAKPRWDVAQLQDELGRIKDPLLLLLEGVEDARNLGFALRSAEALGAHAILIKKHLWDLDAVEVARPASGAYERLPLVQIDSVAPLVALQRSGGMRIFGCIAGAKRTIYDVDFTGPAIIAIGGEKRGLSGALREICDVFVTIPTVGGATSLSLSHAACIVLAEAMRQRRARKASAGAGEDPLPDSPSSS